MEISAIIIKLKYEIRCDGAEIGGFAALYGMAKEDLFQDLTFELRPELLKRTSNFKN